MSEVISIAPISMEELADAYATKLASRRIEDGHTMDRRDLMLAAGVPRSIVTDPAEGLQRMKFFVTLTDRLIELCGTYMQSRGGGVVAFVHHGHHALVDDAFKGMRRKAAVAHRRLRLFDTTDMGATERQQIADRSRALAKVRRTLATTHSRVLPERLQLGEPGED